MKKIAVSGITDATSPENIEQAEPPHLYKETDKWAQIVLTYGMLLLLGATLFPYNFSFESVFSNSGPGFFIFQLLEPSPFNEAIYHLLLFIPLGFGFTHLLRQKNMEGKVGLALLLVTAFILSFLIEILQFLLPSRSPSLIEMVANILGALLGFLCFRWWGEQILGQASALVDKSKPYFSIKNLVIGFVGYTSLIVLISILVQPAAQFGNWDQNFHLILGNEGTGTRPWQGYISEAHILDRAVSEREVINVFTQRDILSFDNSLLASYRLARDEGYRDRTGNLSMLTWRGEKETTRSHHEAGVYMDAESWLETTVPAGFLTQKIIDTAKFTIISSVTPANTTQGGPARIISLSKNAGSRNFTLGQRGVDLVFRLRTPFTKGNAVTPEFVFPNVFVDTSSRHLVITYDGSTLRLHVDSLLHPRSFELFPGPAFFSYTMGVGNDADLIPGYKLLYYGLIFIPLGLLLALMDTRLKRIASRTLLIWSVVLLPPLVLEAVLVAVSGRLINPLNLLLSIAITIVAGLLFKAQIVYWNGKETFGSDEPKLAQSL